MNRCPSIQLVGHGKARTQCLLMGELVGDQGADADDFELLLLHRANKGQPHTS
jgi:hypothetical protein